MKRRKTHLSSSSATSKKRKVVGEEDAQQTAGGGKGAVVGMKLSTGTSNTTSAIGQGHQEDRPRQEFLKTHLQILKTLYHTASTKDHDPNSHDKDDGSDDEDGRVQHDEWKSIDDFLCVRDRLQTLSHQVERMGGIHQEAEKFQHTMDKQIQKQQQQQQAQAQQQQQQQQKDVQVGFGGGSNFRQGWRSAFPAKPPTPTNTNSSPLRSPKKNHNPFTGSGSGNKKNHVNQDGHYRSGIADDNYSDTMTDNNNSNINPAGIMSALLRRKHYIAYKHWKKQVEPFRDLSTKIMERIDALKDQRTKLSSDMIRQNLNLQQEKEKKQKQQQKKKTNAENKEIRVRIDTKIDLWTILHADLEAACRNDMAKWSQELTESQQW